MTIFKIDVRGKCCPTPVLKTKKQLNEMEQGDIVEILVTDQLAPLDIEALVSVTKDKFISAVKETDYTKVVVEKS